MRVESPNDPCISVQNDTTETETYNTYKVLLCLLYIFTRPLVIRCDWANTDENFRGTVGPRGSLPCLLLLIASPFTSLQNCIIIHIASSPRDTRMQARREQVGGVHRCMHCRCDARWRHSRALILKYHPRGPFWTRGSLSFPRAHGSKFPTRHRRRRCTYSRRRRGTHPCIATRMELLSTNTRWRRKALYRVIISTNSVCMCRGVAMNTCSISAGPALETCGCVHEERFHGFKRAVGDC